MELMDGALTERILGACMEVSNILGPGFLESVYHKALFLELQARGLIVESQVAMKVLFKGQVVGDFVADLLVEGRVILELKACSDLSPVHGAQIINYLAATGLRVGLLVNFGRPKLLRKRLVR